MDDKRYHAIIAILVVFLAVTVYMLFQPHETTVVYIGYEQTPFQWYCTEQKVNCSTVTPIVTVTENIEEPYVVAPDGDTLPDPEPVPTTPSLPVSEFPFLSFR